MSKFDAFLGKGMKSESPKDPAGYIIVEKPDPIFYHSFWASTFTTHLSCNGRQYGQLLTHSDHKVWMLESNRWAPECGDRVELMLIHQDEREVQNYIVQSVQKSPRFVRVGMQRLWETAP